MKSCRRSALLIGLVALLFGCKPAEQPAGAASEHEEVQRLLDEGQGVEARQRILRAGLQEDDEGRLLLLRADMISGLYQDALRATLELEEQLPEGFSDDVCVAAVASSLDDEDLERARQNVGQCARLGDSSRIDRRAARWRLHVVSEVEGALEQYGALLDELSDDEDPIIADFVVSTVHDTVIARHSELSVGDQERALRRLIEMTSSYEAQQHLANWYRLRIEALAADGRTSSARRCAREIWNDELTELAGAAPELNAQSAESAEGEQDSEDVVADDADADAQDGADAAEEQAGEEELGCPLRPWPVVAEP